MGIEEQLDRIESKLDKLLEQKRSYPIGNVDSPVRERKDVK